MRAARSAVATAALLLIARPGTGAQARDLPVGIRRVEYVDAGRTLALTMFYPALPARAARPAGTAYFINLRLFRDAPLAVCALRHPLVVFSHGRGGNGFFYAWFAQTLAAHGYIVAALDHYHANSYDSTIVYLANKLWQRPVDIRLVITHLLRDEVWGKAIDASRIGVAGHSQGGFTALWVGGARINPERFLAFQRGWRDNPQVPQYLRAQLPLDAEPAMNVGDPRVKAVFAMAPGVIHAFGMDERGLRALKLPTFITDGAGDTVTPPVENAEFAAKYIPHATLMISPGRVGHNVYVNECDADGKAELPETCADDPSVSRAAIHAAVGAAALRFFDASLPVRRGGRADERTDHARSRGETPARRS